MDNTFFTKKNENLRAKQVEGGPEEGGAKQVPHSPSHHWVRCISELFKQFLFKQFSSALVLQDLFTKLFQAVAHKFRLEKKLFKKVQTEVW